MRRQQEGARPLRIAVVRVQVPAPLVEHDRERIDRALARRALAGLEVAEAHDLPLVERLAQRLERGIPHPQPRRVADHGLARLDAERAQLRERALRVGRERRLAPHLGGEAEQRQFVGREAHLVGEVVLPLGDAVPQGLVVAGPVGRLDGLERDAELADVVFVALELALEVRVLARLVVALRVAAHRREDLGLQQAGLGGEQREHEAEEPILDRDPRLTLARCTRHRSDHTEPLAALGRVGRLRSHRGCR